MSDFQTTGNRATDKEIMMLRAEIEWLRALLDQTYKSEKRLGKEIEKLVDEIVELKKERALLRDDLQKITKQRDHYMWSESQRQKDDPPKFVDGADPWGEE